MGRMLFVTLLTFSAIAPVHSAVDDATLMELRAQIRLLSERLAVLEQQNAAPDTPPGEHKAVQPPAAQPVAAPTLPDWVNGIALKGDFRYRHEMIDEDGRQQRNRHRVRARLNIAGTVREDLQIGIRLASGSDDPISTNQSLDTGASTKGFGLDRAFFDWRLRDGLHLVGGKMPNPLFRPGKSSLLWDDDLNPEGLAVTWDNGRFFINALGAWLEERSSDSDSFMVATQAGFRATLAEHLRLTAGASLIEFDELRGQAPLFNRQGRGNTLDDRGLYPHDFSELNLFAELGFGIGNTPASLFADYVHNADGDRFDTGYLVGAKIGKASAGGTWEAGWIYRDLEADAHPAIFPDSDFAGGGTDGRGHLLTLGYAVAKQWTLNLSYFVNERGANAGRERDYNRLQADLKFKY